jgi:ATP phosphoribosyltransferase regulatory subunit HisZ
MLSKFYSLDECYQKEKVYDHLEELQKNEMILFELVDTDLIKIKDIGLSEKDTKDLLNFFDDKDVIDYSDFDGDDDNDDGFYDDDDYFPNEDFY